jgi:hypothetical protein
LTPEKRELRSRILDELAAICRRGEGLAVEEKPASLALHYRNAAEPVAREALAAVLAGPATRDGIHTRHGKRVVELMLVPTDKGVALQRIRRMVGATAVLFLGDDLTDESAFAALQRDDVSVKVGAGETEHQPLAVRGIVAGQPARGQRGGDGAGDGSGGRGHRRGRRRLGRRRRAAGQEQDGERQTAARRHGTKSMSAPLQRSPPQGRVRRPVLCKLRRFAI